MNGAPERRLPPGLWLGLAGLFVASGLLLEPVLPAPTTRILGELQS